MQECKTKVSILLVDDAPANLVALAAVLDHPDYQLVLAHSGKEALECVRDNEFAVILMDVQMPEMDGFEAARRIRQVPGAKETPIIFVTAIYRDTKFVQSGYAAGGVDYLFKPIDTDIVRSKVAVFVELFLKNKALQLQHERTARLVAVQRITTDVLKNARSTEQAVPEILKEVCKTLVWDFGTFWALDSSENFLRCKYFWSAPSCPASFVSGIVSERFNPGVGLPGRVWLESKAIWAKEGLGSAIAFPIVVGGKVKGVMEFFCRSPQIEDLNLLKIVAAVGNQIGQFVMRNEAIEARDEFISVASHELKTPLTVLKVQAQLSRMKLDRKDSAWFSPDSIGKFLDMSLSQVDRMIELVERMLDVSRIDHGQLSIERSSFDLGEMVRSVAEEFRSHAQSKGSALTVSAQPGIIGEWDRVRVGQIIANLVTNAIKYGGKGRFIEVLVETDSEGVRIAVQDNGPGIAPENLERIFQRFERAVGNENSNGLGLGLYISRQIARAHRGDLRVESKLGKGARFVLELPFPNGKSLRVATTR